MDTIKKYLSMELVTTAALVLAAIAVYILLYRLERRYVDTHRGDSGSKPTFTRIAYRVIRVAVLTAFILAILSVNGVNITSMVAGLGILSAIVGLALQDLLKDLIMGYHIVSDHFFSVGECVEFEGRECVVVGFTMKTTKLGDLDDHSVTTVCNRDISRIRRFGERLDLNIPLSYKEKPQELAPVFEEICGAIAALDHVSRCEYLGVQEFGDFAVRYKLRLHCEPKERADVRRAALGAVQRGLAAHDIVIPFPQLDVHFDK